MSELVEKQIKFTNDLAVLVLVAGKIGYYLTYGEAYRMPNATHGHPRSLHKQRLAVDFNLFLRNSDGDLQYKTLTDDHKVIGELWEKMGNTWGGRFNDGNHYSREHRGMK